MTKTVYIAGPITNMDNGDHFVEAEKKLHELGYKTVNPWGLIHVYGGRSDNYQFWMRESIMLLMRCDAVVFLDGWETSRGCRIERDLVEAIGMEIVELCEQKDNSVTFIDHYQLVECSLVSDPPDPNCRIDPSKVNK